MTALPLLFRKPRIGAGRRAGLWGGLWGGLFRFRRGLFRGGLWGGRERRGPGVLTTWFWLGAALTASGSFLTALGLGLREAAIEQPGVALIGAAALAVLVALKRAVEDGRSRPGGGAPTPRDNTFVGQTLVTGGVLEVGDAAHPNAVLDNHIGGVTVGPGGTLTVYG
jgi:hypothetical protein